MRRIRIVASMMLAATMALTGSVSSLANEARQAAACTATIKVGNLRIASTSTYKIKGTLTNACGTGRGDAWWDMDRGARTFSSWWFPPSPAYAYFYPGIDPVGAYTATPMGAYNSNWTRVPQNTYRFSIKLDSRVSISGYRARRYVYVRARVTRFAPNKNYGLGGWVTR